MTACSKCHKSITFHASKKTRTGKFIPLDVETMKPHECMERYIVECRRCKTKITFENDFRNQNQKCIPIDAYNGLPHNCRAAKATGLDEFFCS